MGKREDYLNQAILKLNQISGCKVEKVSSFHETEPYGGVEQGDFLNCCLKLSTILFPMELLREMQRIENEAGRTREVHWGPRTLDLDLLFFDDLVRDEKELVLPHPDLENRDFVLSPLAEIAPYLRHPISRKNVAEMVRI
jgi:dihydroneopterin aldolase/2-amino-4-hydroxy-6-hydroxymethyldihydropteridine diphosphokinase